MLLSPFRALLWIFRQVQEAADDEQAQRRERLWQSLADLHQSFERGQIDETAFEAREADLLEQLERLPHGRRRA